MEIRNVSFTYPVQENAALSRVNLNIEDGEFVLVCGDSGSGKTTLLKLLKREISPVGERSGEIFVFGKRIEDLSEKESVSRIAYVSQSIESSLVCEDVRRELAFTAESLGFESAEIRRRTAETAMFFGIEHLFRRKVDELSGGEKQLVSLAAAVVCVPDILILDEPCARLDPIASKKLIHYVRRLNVEMGITVIISEHRTDDIFPAASKVVVLDKGHVVFSGGPNEAVGAPSVPEYLLPAASRIYRRIKIEGSNKDAAIDVVSCQQFIRRQGGDIVLDMFENDVCEDRKNKDNIVLLKDVYFSFGGRRDDVLRGLSLDINSGEVLAILGGNGAGKTTLLNVISGVYRCESGRRKAKFRRAGVLPQDVRNLFLTSTVSDDLAMAASVGESAAIDDIVEMMGLRHLLERNPFDLSGGELERAGIAKVLLGQPDIVLLDEPTKGMDRRSAAELCGVIASLKGRGIAVVIVTHDAEIAERCADRCGLLFDGDIVSVETTDKFFAGLDYFTTETRRIFRPFRKNGCVSDEK